MADLSEIGKNFSTYLASLSPQIKKIHYNGIYRVH